MKSRYRLTVGKHRVVFDTDRPWNGGTCIWCQKVMRVSEMIRGQLRVPQDLPDCLPLDVMKYGASSSGGFIW